jgi:hypothetical protein
MNGRVRRTSTVSGEDDEILFGSESMLDNRQLNSFFFSIPSVYGIPVGTEGVIRVGDRIKITKYRSNGAVSNE